MLSSLLLVSDILWLPWLQRQVPLTHYKLDTTQEKPQTPLPIMIIYKCTHIMLKQNHM